ncbi:MAG: phosphoribosylamine--glycine ligase [Candidatus Margulisiibacteriota bacterium]
MNILLIGSGGREHSLALALTQDPTVTLYTAPGNPGTAEVGTNVPIPDTDLNALLAFAQNNAIDLTMVGPEGPLVAGIVDLFTQNGLAIVGPDRIGAQLEGSKAWAKALMAETGIPTASYATFARYEDAKAYCDTHAYPLVIKADGLAAGKGVTIAQTVSEADHALRDCFLNDAFGSAGKTVVIESFLVGQEASLLAFCDGKTILPMLPAQDHKAIFDGDQGPNTGGMGTYCPAPIVTPAVMKKVQKQVFDPLLKGFETRGIVYKGIVYAGLMIDPQGNPWVVEFNARFGDPETQVLLPLLETPLATVLNAVWTGTLDQLTLRWKPASAVCVVLASSGYPGAYPKGKIITGLPLQTPNTQAIHAGTALQNGTLVTNGGRVLGIVGQGPTLQTAIDTAYQGVQELQFEGSYHRTDIGKKGLKTT